MIKKIICIIPLLLLTLLFTFNNKADAATTITADNKAVPIFKTPDELSFGYNKLINDNLSYHIGIGQYKIDANITFGAYYSINFNYLDHMETYNFIIENNPYDGVQIIIYDFNTNSVVISSYNSFQFDMKNWKDWYSFGFYIQGGLVDKTFNFQISETYYTEYLFPSIYPFTQYYEQQGFNEAYSLGYQAGYSGGINSFENTAFEQGYLMGYEEAYHFGYYDGVNATTESGGFGLLLSQVFIGIGSILSIELLPNMPIGAFIAVPIVFGIIAFIIGRKKE